MFRIMTAILNILIQTILCRGPDACPPGLVPDGESE